MSVTYRFGSEGYYYGNDKTSSNPLTMPQMKVNADYIYRYLSRFSFTKEAISALLGNMQAESTINPGRWESDIVGRLTYGYGLVQWTPASKYIDYIGEENDYSTMDNNLSRIIYELNNNLQWIKTSSYNLTFNEFVTSDTSPYELACAFAWNYERSYVVYTVQKKKKKH